MGQHGVGFIADANGAVQAVLRRNGTNGDVVAPAAAASDFQLVDITWGPAGVAVFRNGEVDRHQQGNRFACRPTRRLPP